MSRSTKAPQPLQDRLSDADRRAILDGSKAGVPQQQLAKDYSISVRSVRRLLRKQRAEER